MLQALRALLQQFLLARRARRPHGGEDAAARFGDLFIGLALLAQREFARAVAGVDEMRVAVDEAGG